MVTMVQTAPAQGEPSPSLLLSCCWKTTHNLNVFKDESLAHCALCPYSVIISLCELSFPSCKMGVMFTLLAGVWRNY